MYTGYRTFVPSFVTATQDDTGFIVPVKTRVVVEYVATSDKGTTYREREIVLNKQEMRLRYVNRTLKPRRGKYAPEYYDYSVDSDYLCDVIEKLLGFPIDIKLIDVDFTQCRRDGKIHRIVTGILIKLDAATYRQFKISKLLK